jgi:uncharacterized protein YkwD
MDMMYARLWLSSLLVSSFCFSPVFGQNGKLAQLPPGSTAQTSNQPTGDDLARYCVSLINKSRETEGHLPQLQQDSGLSRLAQSYADYMLMHPERYVRPTVSPHLDLEGHYPMDRARAAGITVEVHENLGMDRRGAKSDYDLVAHQHSVMMAEPSGPHNHRSIILDPEARNVGVGISRNGSLLYLVEEFGH